MSRTHRGDKAFMDGIRESVGDDVISTIAALRQDLEEIEEERSERQNDEVNDERAAEEASKDMEDMLGSPSAEAQCLAAVAVATDTVAQSFTIGSLHVKYTGWACGIIAKAFHIANAGGSSAACSSAASSAAASSTSSPAPLQNQPLGVLHRVNDQGLKLTCKKHPKCVCWVSFRNHDKDETAMKLFQWLSDGLAGTAAQHEDMARDLKIALGMRIRAKKS